MGRNYQNISWQIPSRCCRWECQLLSYSSSLGTHHKTRLNNNNTRVTSSRKIKYMCNVYYNVELQWENKIKIKVQYIWNGSRRTYHYTMMIHEYIEYIIQSWYNYNVLTTSHNILKNKYYLANKFFLNNNIVCYNNNSGSVKYLKEQQFKLLFPYLLKTRIPKI